MVDRRIERDFGHVEIVDEKPARPGRKSKGEREVAFVSPPPTVRGHGHHRKKSKEVNSSGDEYVPGSSRRHSSRTADPFVDPPVNGSAKKHSRRSRRYVNEDDYLVPIVEEDSKERDASAYYGYGDGDYGYGYEHSHGQGYMAGHSERRRRRTRGSGAPEEEYAAYYYY
jgi:hypothetical protein